MDIVPGADKSQNAVCEMLAESFENCWVKEALTGLLKAGFSFFLSGFSFTSDANANTISAIVPFSLSSKATLVPPVSSKGQNPRM